MSRCLSAWLWHNLQQTMVVEILDYDVISPTTVVGFVVVVDYILACLAAVCLCVWHKSQLLHVETCNTASTDLLMNSDHKPKLGRSDLVYWVYRLSFLLIGVLPADGHSLWAGCYCVGDTSED